MSKERSFVQRQCSQLKEGQSVAIERRIFQDAYPCGFPSIYENPEQAFLSSMMGSGCGVWRVNYNLESGNYIISKHPESDKRYYVDPDRAYLFKRMPDGTLERK